MLVVNNAAVSTNWKFANLDIIWVMYDIKNQNPLPFLVAERAELPRIGAGCAAGRERAFPQASY